MNLVDLPYVMTRCLVLTIIVELIVSLILKVKEKKDIINIILVNILTNPLLVSLTITINVYYGLFYRNIATIILEMLAVISEGFIYQKYLKYKKINGYLLSLILNICSYLTSEIINYIIY